MIFDRITIEPGKMGGVPCIRGMRIPVVTVVYMVAEGMTFQRILEDFPMLAMEDIQQALRYAASSVQPEATEVMESA